MDVPIKHFYMIRHGESEANAARILAGHTDSPLTELGREQARRAAQIIEKLEIKPAAIYHSNLSRARETAEIINAVLKLDIIEEPGFAEKHSGILEGRPYAECLDEFLKWIDIEGGETVQDFFARVKTAKIKALNHPHAPVLIACHGGVMRAIGAIHGLMDVKNIKNCHLYEFVPNADNPNFPWNVYDYDICRETGALLKNKAANYEPDFSSPA